MLSGKCQNCIFTWWFSKIYHMYMHTYWKIWFVLATSGCSIGWYTNKRVTSYELISLRVAFIARVTSYELFLLHELRVTFCIRVTSCCLLHELRVIFFVRVTSHCLLHKLRVTFIAQATSCCLLHELRVTFCMRVASYCLPHELRVNF